VTDRFCKFVLGLSDAASLPRTKGESRPKRCDNDEKDCVPGLRAHRRRRARLHRPACRRSAKLRLPRRPERSL